MPLGALARIVIKEFAPVCTNFGVFFKFANSRGAVLKLAIVFVSVKQSAAFGHARIAVGN
jgi:hypothetical protein